MKKQIPDLEWLIPNLAPMNCVNLFSGEPNVGKSRFWLQASSALANGTSFIWNAMEPKRVLYATERDSSEIKCQLQGLGIESLLDNSNFTLYCVGDLAGNDITAFNNDPIKALLIFMGTNKFDIIIMDTITQFCIKLGKTLNLNDYASCMIAVRNLKWLAKTTKSCIFGIHHMRKQGVNDVAIRDLDRSLGSQALIGGCSTMWLLMHEEKQNNNEWPQSLRLSINVHACPSPPDIYLTLDKNQPFVVKNKSIDITKLGSFQSEVALYLFANSPISHSDALKAFATTESRRVSFYRAYKHLHESGYISESRNDDDEIVITARKIS
jgi:RecA-family ATPase